MDQITTRRETVELGIPTFTDAAGRTSTNSLPGTIPDISNSEKTSWMRCGLRN
jgi:hypothetical protein